MSNGTFEPKAFASDPKETNRKYFYDDEGNLEEFEFMILEPSKPLKNVIDFFILGMEVLILVISLIKCGILLDRKLYVVIAGVVSPLNGGIIFDSLEHIVNSPRMLAVFTICYFTRSEFLGSANTIHALQYTILKKFPYYIATLFSID